MSRAGWSRGRGLKPAGRAGLEGWRGLDRSSGLVARGVAWQVEGREILRRIDLDVRQGELAGIIGPNGSGKSSFLRTVYRVLKPDAGLISLDEEDVWKLSVRRAAQRTAAVLQETPAEFEFSVEEMVFMGRTPHKGPLDRETQDDHLVVAESLARVGMTDFAGRSFGTLSGGEKQRVLIARALAQRARFLVLDEPTNHLDIRYQLEILELVQGLGVTTLAALHDLNLAAAYCDRIFVFDEGRVVASGTPAEVLRPDLLRRVFGVGVLVQEHPLTGKTHLVFFHDNALSDLSGGQPGGVSDGAPGAPEGDPMARSATVDGGAG